MMELIYSKEQRDAKLEELRKFKEAIDDEEIKACSSVYCWCLNNIKCLEDMKFN